MFVNGANESCIEANKVSTNVFESYKWYFHKKKRAPNVNLCVVPILMHSQPKSIIMIGSKKYCQNLKK